MITLVLVLRHLIKEHSDRVLSKTISSLAQLNDVILYDIFIIIQDGRKSGNIIISCKC